MKTIRPLILLAAIFGIALACFAQTAAVDAQPVVNALPPSLGPVSPDAAASVANSVVHVLSAVLPPKVASWLVALGSIIGTIGLFTKPVMTVIEAAVKASPSAADDALLDKVEHSPGFKLFAWCLDFFTRVKIGPQFTARPEGKAE